MYALFSALKMREDQRDAFIEASHVNAQSSLRDEPGCLRFDFLLDQKDPLQCFFYEVYRDEEAFKTHEKTLHYDTWMRICGPLITQESALVLMSTSYPEDGVWQTQKDGLRHC